MNIPITNFSSDSKPLATFNTDQMCAGPECGTSGDMGELMMDAMPGTFLDRILDVIDNFGLPNIIDRPMLTGGANAAELRNLPGCSGPECGDQAEAGLVEGVQSAPMTSPVMPDVPKFPGCDGPSCEMPAVADSGELSLPYFSGPYPNIPNLPNMPEMPGCDGPDCADPAADYPNMDLPGLDGGSCDGPDCEKPVEEAAPSDEVQDPSVPGDQMDFDDIRDMFDLDPAFAEYAEHFWDAIIGPDSGPSREMIEDIADMFFGMPFDMADGCGDCMMPQGDMFM